MNYAQRYVANGAAVLDERGPKNWREMLRAERGRIDVYSMSDCVLGILYGGYSVGRDTLWPGIDFTQGDALWEIISRHGFDYGLEAEAEELTRAWVELLDADVLV